MISWQLIRLSDYNSLFALYGNLENYQASWLVSLVMKLASLTELSPLAVLQALFGSMDAALWLLLLTGLVLLLSPGKRKWKIMIAGLCILQILCAAAAAAAALQSGALSEVIRLLQILGMIEGTAAIVLAVSGLSMTACAVIAAIPARSPSH